MKYIILSRGCPFGDGDTIWGYVKSKESAISMCNTLNKQSGLEEDYYFIEADKSSSLYRVNLCLEGLIKE